MSQEQKRPASKKAPRTRIEDIPRAGDELSEEEASQITGGMGRAAGGGGGTREPASCTVNNDTDFVAD